MTEVENETEIQSKDYTWGNPRAITTSWTTPERMFSALSLEFGFFDDPCPIEGEGGLDRKWGFKTFVNPPYGKEIRAWIEKAIAEIDRGNCHLIVMLLPARTGNPWFHELILEHASEIRFCKGRVRFGGSPTNAPFDSMIVVFDTSWDRDEGLRISSCSNYRDNPK